MIFLAFSYFSMPKAFFLMKNVFLCVRLPAGVFFSDFCRYYYVFLLRVRLAASVFLLTMFFCVRLAAGVFWVNIVFFACEACRRVFVFCCC